MTVIITTLNDNELVSHELHNVISIFKALDNIMFVQDNGTYETWNYNDITFTVR